MIEIDIGIAGGGIGGLALSIALSRLGHTVTIYEAASALVEIGAGIQITPNASKHLLRWGVGEHLPDFRANNAPCFKVRRWRDGTLIGRMETEEHWKRYGGPYVQVHRADLQQSLLKVAERNGVHVHTNMRIVDYDFDSPALITQDGGRIEKDLVFAADGIKSIARRKLGNLADLTTVSTGLAVFRATLDVSAVSNDPELAHLYQEPGINLWIGPHKHAVVYAMHSESLVNLVLECPEPKDPSEWDESTYVKDIQAIFQGWDPSLTKLLWKIESALKWPLRFSVPLERWSSESGKFTLVGDAAHVVPSFLAQGAAMAIEDAASLAKYLSGIPCKEEIPKAIRAFGDTRMRRKIKVQELSLHHLRLYHLEDGEEQRRRDGLERGNEELSPIWRNLEEQSWLYGHDI